MPDTIPREVLLKIRKLARLLDESRQCRSALPISRLTILKSLCREHEFTDRFVTYLAMRTMQKVAAIKKPPRRLSEEDWSRQNALMNRAVSALVQYSARLPEEHRDPAWPSQEHRDRLCELCRGLTDEHDEYKRIRGASVRIIKNPDLLLVEYALQTVLADEDTLPAWAYQTARHYAERFDSRHGTGLTPKSAPLVQDIVDFWMSEFRLTVETLEARPSSRTLRPKHK
jgi:hypothetical protein